jgi:PilZ domain
MIGDLTTGAQKMLERRRTQRNRVIYHGRIAYNERLSTIDCVVRNFSNDGVKVEFDNLALLPDEVDLFIAKKNRSFRARLAWRNVNRAGLTFRPSSRSDVIPLDWAQRLRRSESERRMLQKRLAQLLSEH